MSFRRRHRVGFSLSKKQARGIASGALPHHRFRLPFMRFAPSALFTVATSRVGHALLFYARRGSDHEARDFSDFPPALACGVVGASGVGPPPPSPCASGNRSQPSEADGQKFLVLRNRHWKKEGSKRLSEGRGSRSCDPRRGERERRHHTGATRRGWVRFEPGCREMKECVIGLAGGSGGGGRPSRSVASGTIGVAEPLDQREQQP